MSESLLNKREAITTSTIEGMKSAAQKTQDEIYSRILDFAGKLERSNGVIKPTAKNLKLMNRFVHVDIKGVLKTGDYKKQVNNFVKSFDEIGSLTDQYFEKIESEKDA